MGNFISKFNLYEYFRILLPGAYLTFLGYVLFQNSCIKIPGDYHWSIIVLLTIISSLLLGAFIYSLDIPRIFKNHIDLLPTNLMSSEFPKRYPKTKENERIIEHGYYQWYEKSTNKSKSKTELLSGLYHLNLNFSGCSLIGIIIGIIILCKSNQNFILYFNLLLFFISSFTAFIIVKRRLRYQWQRNYWEFKFEYIRSNPER